MPFLHLLRVKCVSKGLSPSVLLPRHRIPVTTILETTTRRTTTDDDGRWSDGNVDALPVAASSTTMDDGFRYRAAAPDSLTASDHCNNSSAGRFCLDHADGIERVDCFLLALEDKHSKRIKNPNKQIQRGQKPKQAKQEGSWEEVTPPGYPAWSVGWDYSSHALGPTAPWTLDPGTLNSKFRNPGNLYRLLT